MSPCGVRRRSPWTPWRGAASTTRWAVASTGTAWTPAGRCRTSRRCCMTTRSSRRCTCTRFSCRDATSCVMCAREPLTISRARCCCRPGASPPRRTPTPPAARVPSSYGRRRSCATCSAMTTVRWRLASTAWSRVGISRAAPPYCPCRFPWSASRSRSACPQKSCDGVWTPSAPACTRRALLVQRLDATTR